jgi:hypothetical protein
MIFCKILVLKAPSSLQHGLLVADSTVRSLSTHLYRQHHTHTHLVHPKLDFKKR